MSTISSNSLASSWASNIFSKLDTGNQGYIDKSTLQSAFDKISSSSSSASNTTSTSSSSSSVDSLFSSMDSDSDGKVTKSELTTALEKVADQLNNSFDQMRMGHGKHGGMDGAGGPPPGPPPSDGGNGNTNDTGLTKDQLTQQLQDIGTSDSKRSDLISNIVNNFDKADADGDGKVTAAEARAYDQSQKSSASSSSGASSSSDSSGSTANDSDAAFMMQIMKLAQAYGTDSSTSSLLSSSLSVSA